MEQVLERSERNNRVWTQSVIKTPGIATALGHRAKAAPVILFRLCTLLCRPGTRGLSFLVPGLIKDLSGRYAGTDLPWRRKSARCYRQSRRGEKPGNDREKGYSSQTPLISQEFTILQISSHRASRDPFITGPLVYIFIPEQSAGMQAVFAHFEIFFGISGLPRPPIPPHAAVLQARKSRLSAAPGLPPCRGPSRTSAGPDYRPRPASAARLSMRRVFLPACLAQ